jgi:hypothetical protein
MEREHVAETEERAGESKTNDAIVDCGNWLDLRELVRVGKIL